ncbi:hypothetical protein HMI55_001281 [Coelomomyces lativittatus]|nr:hypothetical protein HMI55_001281 [Coelomomyces lativittatus]
MHQWAGISVSKYTPILKRVVCESVEARTIKLKEKNERKAKYLKDENNKTHLVALELG